MILDFEGAGVFRLMTASTIERDIVLTNALRSSGVEQAMVNALSAGREPDSEIFAAVTSSGKLFDILGALLIPDGMEQLEWTAKIGQETADKLRRLTADQAKQLVIHSIVALVKACFLKGLSSLATSQNSSLDLEKVVQPAGANAAITTSAIGRSWFASLATSIRSAVKRCFGGR